MAAAHQVSQNVRQGGLHEPTRRLVCFCCSCLSFVCQFAHTAHTCTYLHATAAQLLDWTQRSGLSHEQQQRETIRLATYGLQPSPLLCSRQYVLLASGFSNIPDTGAQYDRVLHYCQHSVLHLPQRGIFRLNVID